MIGVNVHGVDTPSATLQREGKMWRIVIWTLWVALLSWLIYVLAIDLSNVGPRVTGAVKLVNILEQLPALWPSYALLLALTSVWIYRHWTLLADLRREFSEKQRTTDSLDMAERDWWVAEGFRKRALDLRLRADLFVGGLVILLFGGIYFVVFVSSQIPFIDIEKVKLRQELEFKDTFRRELDGLVAGSYWLKSNFAAEGIEALKDAANDAHASPGHRAIVFLTTDGGINWSRHQELEFTPGEWNPWAAFGADGETVVVSGEEGSVYLTTDAGKTWSESNLLRANDLDRRMTAFAWSGQTGLVVGTGGSIRVTTDGGNSWSDGNLSLEGSERAVEAALSEDGKTGLVVSTRGSIHITTDAGKSWTVRDSNMKDGDWVAEATLSANGKTGLVVSGKGSIRTTTDGGETWRHSDLKLPRGQQTIVVTSSASGDTALVGGTGGSILITTDGGNKWRARALKWPEREWPNMAALSAHGRTGLVAGTAGSLSMTTDGGDEWNTPALKLPNGTGISAIALSADGTAGLVVGRDGSLHMTADSGTTWQERELNLSHGEYVVAGRLSKNGTSGMLVVAGSSVFVTTDGGMTWRPTSLKLAQGEGVVSAPFDKKGLNGVVVSSRNMYVTRDGGGSWNKNIIALGPEGRFASAAWSADGESSVIAGKEGSAWVSWDGGWNWISTQGLGEVDRSGGPMLGVSLQLVADDGRFVAETEHGYYALSTYPSLKGWEDWSLERIRNILSQDEALKNSRMSRSLDVRRSSENRKNNRLDDGNSTFADLFTDVAIMRIVTVAFVFFLAQVLIRLYQYNLRLSAFWESRADAVLLKRSIGVDKAKSFSGLVNTLSPESYDFGSRPKSPTDGFRLRVNRSAD